MKPTDYLSIIQQFLDGALQAYEFATIYDKAFLSEPGIMEKELFDILEDFWEDVDAYSPLWEPEDIDGAHITEQTLRDEAIIANEKLEKYLGRHPE